MNHGKTGRAIKGIVAITLKMLVALAVLCLTAGGVALCEATPEEAFFYTFAGDTATITGIDPDLAGADVVIPETLQGYPVTAIDEGALSGEAIKTLQVPAGVTRIGDGGLPDGVMLIVAPDSYAAGYAVENDIQYRLTGDGATQADLLALKTEHNELQAKLDELKALQTEADMMIVVAQEQGDQPAIDEWTAKAESFYTQSDETIARLTEIGDLLKSLEYETMNPEADAVKAEENAAAAGSESVEETTPELTPEPAPIPTPTSEPALEADLVEFTKTISKCADQILNAVAQVYFDGVLQLSSDNGAYTASNHTLRIDHAGIDTNGGFQVSGVYSVIREDGGTDSSELLVQLNETGLFIVTPWVTCAYPSEDANTGSNWKSLSVDKCAWAALSTARTDGEAWVVLVNGLMQRLEERGGWLEQTDTGWRADAADLKAVLSSVLNEMAVELSTLKTVEGMRLMEALGVDPGQRRIAAMFLLKVLAGRLDSLLLPSGAEIVLTLDRDTASVEAGGLGERLALCIERMEDGLSAELVTPDGFTANWRRAYAPDGSWTDEVGVTNKDGLTLSISGKGAPSAEGASCEYEALSMAGDTAYDIRGNWVVGFNGGAPAERLPISSLLPEANFADAGMEALVRLSLNRPTGPIYVSDLSAFINLPSGGALKKYVAPSNAADADWFNTASNALYQNESIQIRSFDDLKYFSSLKRLAICFQDSPIEMNALTGMEGLEWLCLVSDGLEDVEVLRSMSHLKYLNLDGNRIIDTSPLSSLEQAGCAISLQRNPTETVLSEAPTPKPTLTPTPGLTDADSDAASTAAELPAIKPLGDMLVWHTTNGRYYHLDEHCPGTSDQKQHTLSSSVDEGFKPCARCKPPSADLLGEESVVWCGDDLVFHITDECSSLAENWSARSLNQGLLEDGYTGCPVCGANLHEAFLRMGVQNSQMPTRSSTHTSTVLPSSASAEAAIQFDDQGIEELVRVALGRPDGSIYPSDMASITSLPSIDQLRAFASQHKRRFNPEDVWALIYEFWSNPPLVTPIVSLNDLAYCPMLERLYLVHQPIDNLSALSGLKNLRELVIAFCDVQDITPLRDLSSLSMLDLRNNQIDDLSALVGLTSLEMVSLDQNKISDIKSLQRLTGLNGLFLRWNQIEDVTPLSGLKALRNLNLSNNHISNVKPLSNLESLDALYVDGNKIVDTSPLWLSAQSGCHVYLEGNPTTTVVEAFTPVKKGDSGSAVQAIQDLLIDTNYLYDTSDGEFGENTRQAVMDLQQDHDIDATGEINDATLGLLYSQQSRKPFKARGDYNLALLDGSYDPISREITFYVKNTGAKTLTSIKLDVWAQDSKGNTVGCPIFSNFSTNEDWKAWKSFDGLLKSGTSSIITLLVVGLPSNTSSLSIRSETVFDGGVHAIKSGALVVTLP